MHRLPNFRRRRKIPQIYFLNRFLEGRPMSGKFNWREHLAVHPAAELFPLMSEAELKELAADIEKDGLRIPTVMWPNSDRKLLLIDGRNRLDALALLGRLGVDESECLILKDPRPNDHFQFECAHDVSDPYALALSLNVHRRHLTAEQKRDLIAKLLKVTPEKSNSQIADQVKVSHPTVAKVREQLEDRGDVEKITASIDFEGPQAAGEEAEDHHGGHHEGGGG